MGVNRAYPPIGELEDYFAQKQESQGRLSPFSSQGPKLLPSAQLTGGTIKKPGIASGPLEAMQRTARG